MRILGDETALDAFTEASNILYKAVAHTLGPEGRNTAVIVDTRLSNNHHYSIINDGKMIIENITSDSPAVAPALETIKQASFETNKKAGDGTTSTIIMLNTLLNGCAKLVKEGKVSPVGLKNKLLYYRDSIVDVIDKEIMTKLNTSDYKKVCEVAMGSSQDTDIIVDAFKFAGKDGVVSLGYGETEFSSLEKIDGIPLDKVKLASELFLSSDGETLRETRECNVLLIKNHIDRFVDLVPALNIIKKHPVQPTIIFYDAFSIDVIENLYINHRKGNFDIIPISLTSYGNSKEKIYQMLEAYTGAKQFDNLENKLSDIKIEDLGHLDYSRTTLSNVIIRTKKSPEYESWLKNNKDSINTKSCIVKVGATNKIELEEKYRRIEDTVNSLRNAIRSGVVPGGGVAYKRAFSCLDFDLEDPLTDVIKKALSSVYERNLYNMNLEPSDDTEELIPFEGELHTAEELSIYDSSEVVKQVVINSFTLVSSVITTEALVHDMVR